MEKLKSTLIKHLYLYSDVLNMNIQNNVILAFILLG